MVRTRITIFFQRGKSLKLNDLVYCIKKMIKSQYTPPF